ncbi:MAG: FAD-dependent oxidoreductase [Verrucomicrobiae bacterium]|nr:FAD-dependent oxidoreductase [Verrucomicrobiae bacterium]
MKTSKRVVIVGGGVIGLCTAYFCARAGHAVTVVERSAPPRGGCSFGNAGLIVPSHFVPLAAPGMVALGLRWLWNPESPFFVQPRLNLGLLSWGYRFWRASTPERVRCATPVLRDLHLESRALYEELQSLPVGEFGLTRRGLLMLCQTPHGLEEEGAAAAQAEALGIPVQVLDARGAANLDPEVTMQVTGAVYYPGDCHLEPGRFMAALEAEAGRLGVQFLWGTGGISGPRTANGRVVALRLADGSEVEADECVIAGGSWSEALARGFDLRIPMQAGKGYSLTLPHPRQMPSRSSILTEARVAVTPMGGAVRFGGTMEIGGLDERINRARIRGIVRAATTYFPEFLPGDFEDLTPWCGLRPCSPDGLPYLGRTARWPNVVIATGHAMIGMSLAPVTGRIVSSLITGAPPGHDLSLLNPDRYA